MNLLLLAGKNKPGTAGTLMPGAEIKLVNPGPNGDGEICYRVHHCFRNYATVTCTSHDNHVL